MCAKPDAFSGPVLFVCFHTAELKLLIMLFQTTLPRRNANVDISAKPYIATLTESGDWDLANIIPRKANSKEFSQHNPLL
jgi:hypothetical protein